MGRLRGDTSLLAIEVVMHVQGFVSHVPGHLVSFEASKSEGLGQIEEADGLGRTRMLLPCMLHMPS